MNAEFFIRMPFPAALDRAAIIGAELISISPHGQLTTRTAIALVMSCENSQTRSATIRVSGM